MFVVRDIIAAVLCFLAIRSLVEHSDKYPRVVRVVYIAAWTAFGVVFLVDLVWPIRALAHIALAGFCLVREVVLLLSPSAGLPRSYVWMLRIGWAMAFIGISLYAGVRIGLVPYQYATGMAAGIVTIVGGTLTGIALLALRPKGKPWGGVY